MEVNKEINSDSTKKSRKKSKFDQLIMKVDFQHFGYNNLPQDFKFMKSVVKIAMHVWYPPKKKKQTPKQKTSTTILKHFSWF